MTIRVEMHGEYPSYVEKCFGTTAEILAHIPTVRMAEGFSTDGGGQGTWVAENDTWVGFTNAPGSPSSPFTTTDQRTAWATANLATLRSGVSTVWGPGDSTEYVWNGPLATDWVMAGNNSLTTEPATGITTLTGASPQTIRFTGTGQTCKLPVTTTLPDGLSYYFINDGVTPLSVTDSADAVVGSISVGGFGRAMKLSENTWRVRQDAPFVGVFDNEAAIPADNPGDIATTVLGEFFVGSV